MLTLEGIGLTTSDLQIEESRQIRYFFLNGSQSYHTIQLSQTVSIVNSLRSLIRNIWCCNGHQFFIRNGWYICFLQALCLLGTYLIEKLAHGTTIGKVFLTRIIHLRYHLECQFLCFWRELVFLLLGEDTHNLIQLVGIIIFDIEEITESTTESDIDTEQVFHFRTVTCCNDHKLASVIFHAFHQLFQSLCALVITFPTLAERSQRIGLINK